MHYDLLAKIKNAQRAEKESFITPFSKMDFAIARVLVEAGYLRDAQKKTMGRHQALEVKLKYRDKRPAVNDFRILSKPSRHYYVGYRELQSVKQGQGIGVLSTPQGIMSNRAARKEKVGGEYLFQIW
jgi:small subunit ribosomal protein S8